MLTLAAVVGPTLLAHQSAADHQPQRGHVDRVLDDVCVGARVAVQHQRFNARVLNLQQDPLDDLGQRVRGRGGQRLAGGDRTLGLVESAGHGPGGQQARLVRDLGDRDDALALRVGDVDRVDAGLGERVAIALIDADAGAQERHRVTTGDDVAPQSRPVGHLVCANQPHVTQIGRSAGNLIVLRLGAGFERSAQ